MTWIQTFTGRQFDLADPQRGSIDVVDMAHALSLLCRFNGHVRQHYSVAQHCVIVSHLVPSEHAYAGLLHDASEAYVGDVSKPLKMLLPDYQRVEQRVWEAVAAWAGLPTVLPKTVKHADMVALFWERRDLLATPPTAWTDERWWECGTCQAATADMDADDLDVFDDNLDESGEAHGIDHERIDGVWMVPTETCISQEMDSDAHELTFALPDGTYPVFLDWDEGFLTVQVLQATNEDRHGQ